MKGKKFWKAGLAAFLCLSVLLAQPILAETIDDLQEQAQDIEDEKESINDQIEEADRQIEEKEKELEQLNEQISGIENEIDDLNITIYNCNETIAGLETEIDDREQEIEADYQMLRKRIRTIYMSGGTSDLEVLLGAKNFEEFIDASALVKAVSKHDKKLIDGLKDAISKINDDIKEVEQKREELIAARQTMEATREELDSLKIQADAAAEELRALKGDLTEELHTITAEQENLYAQIEEMIRQKEEEERRRQEQNPISTSGDDGTSNPGGPAAEGYAQYVWPAPGCNYITSYWGDNRGHQGLDLACPGSAYGMDIVAAASGTVTIANSTDEWGSGWGYHIMIDHGDGYSTLYAHCSQVLVSVGQYVEAGQLIGYIGNTGNSFGAHLHFETWYYSTRYDPSPHLGL